MEMAGLDNHVCTGHAHSHIGLGEMMNYTDEAPEIVDPADVARKMKTDYTHSVKDHTTKALEVVCEHCWKLERSEHNTQDFLRETAELISKYFGIASVAIAVRDPLDKLYRYKIVNGVEKEVVEGFKNIAYTRDQVNDDKTYPGHEISSHTKIYLAEEHPYANGEEFSYKRPGLIGMKRRAITDSLEADYIDFFFYGPDKDILGWIETSGTRLRKLPDSTTIRWIELIAFLVGRALQTRK